VGTKSLRKLEGNLFFPLSLTWKRLFFLEQRGLTFEGKNGTRKKKSEIIDINNLIEAAEQKVLIDASNFGIFWFQARVNNRQLISTKK
jgi:hypothetical protein